MTTRKDVQMTLDAEGYFAKTLKEERTRRRLTHKQIAEWSGIPVASISLFESGLRKPSFNTLVRLAVALRVSSDYLLGTDPLESQELPPDPVRYPSELETRLLTLCTQAYEAGSMWREWVKEFEAIKRDLKIKE